MKILDLLYAFVGAERGWASMKKRQVAAAAGSLYTSGC